MDYKKNTYIKYIKNIIKDDDENTAWLSWGIILALNFFGLFLLLYNNDMKCLSANVDPSKFCSAMTITVNNSGPDTEYAPVRVPFVGSGLQSLNYMDNLGSQLLASDPTYNDINFMNQGINQTTSQGYWFTINDLNNGVNLINYFFGANNDVWRDNGIYFYNNDSVTIPNDTAFNIGDNLSISATTYISNLASWTCPLGVPSIDQGFILDRWDSNTGYAIGIECEQGVLYNFALIDSTKIRSPVSAGYNTPYTLKMEYISPDINLYVDGVLATTGTSGTLSTYNNDITIGNNLNNTWVLSLNLSKFITTTNTIELQLNFDPTDMEETGFPSTGVYTGSVEDSSGNGHDGTYTFNRNQTAYTLSLGTPSNVGIQNFVDNPALQKTFTNPIVADFTTVGDENQFFPFYPFLDNAGSNSGLPRGAIFGGLFSVVAMLSASIVVLVSRKVPLGIITYGFIMYIGDLNNFYSSTYTYITLGLLVLLYISSKWVGDKL
tara:strand:+ start:9636 stop:11111 length:1476 start_codon:yes stop_codon:yes gene_type:complete